MYYKTTEKSTALAEKGTYLGEYNEEHYYYVDDSIDVSALEPDAISGSLLNASAKEQLSNSGEYATQVRSEVSYQNIPNQCPYFVKENIAATLSIVRDIAVVLSSVYEQLPVAISDNDEAKKQALNTVVKLNNQAEQVKQKLEKVGL